MTPHRITGLLLTLVFAHVPAARLVAAVRGDRAQYIGGSATSLRQGMQGRFDLSDHQMLRFAGPGGQYVLAYQQVESLEFGQKVGRRVGASIALGVTMLGVGALPVLFSKKKKHYLTIGYRSNDGTRGAAVFELAKDTVRPVLAALEARTGKVVEQELAQ